MGAIDKVVQPLAGRPVLAWSLEALCAVPEVAEIVVVVGPRNEAAAREIVAPFRARRPIALCRGGALRQESVAAGVARLSAGIDLVLIHDAARPLVSPDLIAQGIAAGHVLGAAIAAVPVSDTVKRVAADGVVVETPPRA
ncbi:MAG: 2-C-methyl-D-erythritol 4-phosphate cytidylyltransferase, partial [Thermomicrobiaceae bacterium]|nr:2-C-methyl-D-erythritol 4-phosphate cytidylyltransferase [Thermomicrobiaceae bacterium]